MMSSRQMVRVAGAGILERFDIKWGKWNKCGRVMEIDDEFYYVTRKRDVLHMYGKMGSLGVSKDILDFLKTLTPVPKIMFKLGKKKPLQTFTTTVEKLLKDGKQFAFSNEQDVTCHLRLEELDGAHGQTRLEMS